MVCCCGRRTTITQAIKAIVEEAMTRDDETTARQLASELSQLCALMLQKLLLIRYVRHAYILRTCYDNAIVIRTLRFRTTPVAFYAM